MICLGQFWRKEDEGRRKIRARFVQNEKQEMMGGKEEEEKEESEKKLSHTEEFICNNEKHEYISHILAASLKRSRGNIWVNFPFWLTMGHWLAVVALLANGLPQREECNYMAKQITQNIITNMRRFES